jgi:hypothetical protein
VSPELTDLLTAFVTAALPFLAFQLNRWVKANITPKQFASVAALARTAVDAAEELGRVGNLTGAQKFELAQDTILRSARRVGLKLTPEEVGAFINQSVRDIRWEPEGV